MKIFTYPECSGPLFFENMVCSCGTSVAFDPSAGAFVAVATACANRDLISCNWSADGGELCRSCEMTTVRPDLAVTGNDALWSNAELAKRWVLACVMRWSWFSDRDSGPRPEFHMLAEATKDGQAEVVMGHDSGLVTLNLAEADPAERIRRRDQLGEPYRTMIGHTRHELAHFLFERLGRSSDFLNSFRSLFGNETEDYAQALAAYYESGPPAGWQESHITPYATAHPHEDWAESTAHTLHMTDIVDSFSAAGLSGSSLPGVGYDAYSETDPQRLIGYGVELGIALNHVNRSMGLSDLYPFVNSQRAREKLAFAHEWLSAGPPG